ncbi:MAG TPA: hypothetical protein VGO62_09470 [Myxococcota bacterium]|jgi:hypothetical protein
MNAVTTTDTIVVLSDPAEIILALCDADEWELARRLARANDRAPHR